MPPSSNTDNFFGQKVSQAGIPVNQANDNQLLYKNDFSTQTFYDNSGVPRVLLGLLPDGGYGLIASLPGQDATTSNNLAFSSEQITGTLTFAAQTLNNSNYIYSEVIPHNLGYVPNFNIIAQVYNDDTFSSGGEFIYVNISGSFGSDAINFFDNNTTIYEYQTGIDANNLYVVLSFSNTGSAVSLQLNAQYYIIKQQIVS